MLLKDMIDNIPMCEFFSKEEKEQFAGIDHSVESFQKGDIILKEGDASSVIYLLVKGTALVTQKSDEAQIRLARLGTGEIFGNMSFLSNEPRKSNVVANEDILAVKMDKDFFDRVDPAIKDKIKNYFIELLLKRLDTVNSSIMLMSKVMRAK